MSRQSEKVTFEIYRDVDGGWRSRLLRFAFGKTFIVTDGGEAYKRRIDVVRATENIIKAIKAGNVVTKIVPLIAFLLLAAGCSNLSTHVFRAEQAAVTVAYGGYVGWTNYLLTALASPTLSDERRASLVIASNDVKQARLRFAATLSTIESMRETYETNSALKGPLRAALPTISAEASNVCWLITYWRSQ